MSHLGGRDGCYYPVSAPFLAPSFRTKGFTFSEFLSDPVYLAGLGKVKTMGIWSSYVGLERGIAHKVYPKRWTKFHTFVDSPKYETLLKVELALSVAYAGYMGYRAWSSYKAESRWETAFIDDLQDEDQDDTPPRYAPYSEYVVSSTGEIACSASASDECYFCSEDANDICYIADVGSQWVCLQCIVDGALAKTKAASAVRREDQV